MATLNKTNRNYRVRKIFEKEIYIALYTLGEEVYGEEDASYMIDDEYFTMEYFVNNPEMALDDLIRLHNTYDLDNDHPITILFYHLLQYWENCME